MRQLILTLCFGLFSFQALAQQAPATAQACKEPDKMAISQGMKVVASWQGDSWWVATVDKINGEYIEVTYSDKTNGVKKMAEVVPHPDVLYASNVMPCFKTGDLVISQWQGDHWWKATVDKVTNDIVELTFADGEKGVHKVKEMVRVP